MGKQRKMGRRQHPMSTKFNPKKAFSAKVRNKINNKLVKQKAIKTKSKFVSPYMLSTLQKQKRQTKTGNNDESGAPNEEFNVNDIMDMIDNKELRRIKKTNNNKRPNWALDEDNDNCDRNVKDYELIPRKAFTNDNKKLKTSHINNSEDFKSKTNDNKSNTEDVIVGNNDNISENDETSGAKSLVELLGERNAKLEQLKARVAHIANAIISHPEINVNKLRELLSMFDIKSDDKEYGLIFFSIQKIVAFAALEVFRDIIPNYRVKEKINEEDDQNVANKRKNFRLKKDTQRLRDYEKSLIQLYRLYLLRLERMVECVSKGKKSKKSNFYDEMLPSRRAKQRLSVIGVKCFTELLVTHPHFNFRTQIIETIVPLMANNMYREISDICFEAIIKLYKNDKLGEVSLEAVKCTSKLVKERNYRVDAKVLNSFLFLKIKEIKLKENNKKDMKKIRSKLNLMSRKEKKRNKRMQKLENQLLETEATESRERKLNFHTEILKYVFSTYFRLLKKKIQSEDDNENDRKWFKGILSPVLEGLSKFAHLISIEFFDDLITVLYSLLRDNQLDDHQCLHSLQTIFTILSGEGNALNIDFQRFYSQLYVILLNINVNTNETNIRALIACFNAMIVKRKKQMTQNRVLAFIKRLSIVTLQTTPQTSVAMLAVMRQLFLDHKQSDILIDSEDASIGSGVYLPEVDDPEHCNANSTLLYEMQFHSRHYDRRIQKFAKHIINGCKGSDLTDFIKKQPLVLFDELVNSDELLAFECFNETLLRKKARKQFNNDLNNSFIAKCLTTLQECDNKK